MRANGIAPFAISPDPPEILRRFAEKFGIVYPLLSDEDSRVIRDFGIFNDNIPEDHEWYGIPLPGTYMVGRDGRVFERSFYADHAERESVNDMLQENYRVADLERGEAHILTTPHLEAKAYFAAPTVRPAQRTVLTVEVDLAAGMHVYGQPLPEGYIPVSLSVDGGDALKLLDVAYPAAESFDFEAIGETLPAYAGRLVLKAHCLGTAREEQRVQVAVQLRYQACDDRACYLPQNLEFKLPVDVLPHDWERLDS